ncbi:phosphonate C-P lyase system protein PhnH [Fuscibacter oryzae]|uniref:Phosphonate C-P lyase system protein PhnH n=1 Tax=Fuscibacter oryzae TaxID=2803939 RepID=A0A8J7SU53_9RHOB|nr:phosphonate C-P lyase system protein PhnH [Fuscibacter oryzae]MBL4929255.1 phosphonate C-P lyase system protein PhnH [Fuscibacter oryzae]
MTPEALMGGFTAPPQHSSRAFRAALTALSRPGTIVTVEGGHGPAPLSPAAAILALTLLDGTTPVHLAGGHDAPALRDWLAFHTGAPVVGAEGAAFAIGTWAALQPIPRFAIGTAEYPDRAATLIIEMPALTATGPRLSGPGIDGTAQLSLPEAAAFRANRALFPLGFDCFLTCGSHLAGLPRSTIVEDI